jgi:hypothetical protein
LRALRQRVECVVETLLGARQEMPVAASVKLTDGWPANFIVGRQVEPRRSRQGSAAPACGRP